MTARVAFSRRPGETCDWCSEVSPFVTLVRYSHDVSGWGERLRGESLVCAACSQRSTRVALDHEGGACSS